VIQACDRFRVILGCFHNQPDCSITFELNVRVGDELFQKVGVWEEVYDGQVVEVDIDLKKFAGHTVSSS
jgi:hypothetical protein